MRLLVGGDAAVDPAQGAMHGLGSWSEKHFRSMAYINWYINKVYDMIIYK